MTSSTIHLSPSLTRAKNPVYLVSAVYDLTFICGGLVLALTALCLFKFGLDAQLAQQSTPTILLGIFGTYVLSGPHSAATLFRLYGEAENRRRFQFVSFILPAILVITFGLALFVPAIARLEAILYLVLIWHHVMAQCYGIALMYCARASIKLTDRDKLWPKAILYLAVTTAIAQQFTADFQRRSFLKVDLQSIAFLPQQFVAVLQTLLLLSVIAFLLQQSAPLRRGQGAMPLPAVAALLSGALFLSMGRSLSELVWIFVPAFFHASQYLSVVLAYQLKKSSERNACLSVTKKIEHCSNRLAEYFVLGLVLFLAVPFVVSALGFPLYLCSALAFFSVNLHHFAADACIWKLKDKSIGSRLVS